MAPTTPFVVWTTTDSVDTSIADCTTGRTGDLAASGSCCGSWMAVSTTSWTVVFPALHGWLLRSSTPVAWLNGRRPHRPARSI